VMEEEGEEQVVFAESTAFLTRHGKTKDEIRRLQG